MRQFMKMVVAFTAFFCFAFLSVQKAEAQDAMEEVKKVAKVQTCMLLEFKVETTHEQRSQVIDLLEQTMTKQGMTVVRKVNKGDVIMVCVAVETDDEDFTDFL